MKYLIHVAIFVLAVACDDGKSKSTGESNFDAEVDNLVGKEGLANPSSSLNSSTGSQKKLASFEKDTSIYDFFVQDVCVVNGEVTATDPVKCKGQLRNIRLGEKIPYRKVTGHVPGVPNGRLENSDSFPVLGPNKEKRVMHTFNIATPWDAANYRTFMDFDEPDLAAQTSITSLAELYPHSDGYEVHEFNGDYISILGTRDAHGIAVFWGANCGDDAWVSTPSNLASLGSSNYFRASIGSQRYLFTSTLAEQSSCLPATGESGTYYLKGVYGFNEGKVLETLISSHYSHATVGESDSMERFYYTREYGRTRWERWERGLPADSIDHSCTGPTEDQGFGRLYCREFTTVVEDPDGGFDPRVIPIAPKFAQGNLLQNGSFLEQNKSVWQTFAELNMSFSRSSVSGGALFTDGNSIAILRGKGAGSSIFQDVVVSKNKAGSKVSFGVKMSADEGTKNVLFGVWEINGANTKFHSKLVQVGDETKHYTDSLTLKSDARHLRFQIYVNDGDTIRVDNAFLVRD